MPRGRPRKIIDNSKADDLQFLPRYSGIVGQMCLEDGEKKCKSRGSCLGCQLQKFCAYFTKGNDGFCNHYTGSHKTIAGCYDKCNLGERHKAKRFK